MKNTFKKLLSFVFIVLATFNTIPASAAYDTIVSAEEYSVSVVGDSYISQYVDIDEFKNYLIDQLYACNETIDIASFKLPFAQKTLNEIAEFIRVELPEAFHVNSSISGRGREYFNTLSVTYKYKGTVFQNMAAEFRSEIDGMLVGIKGNDKLSDVEKALLLHDRLALRCEYDYTLKNNTAYDAIVNGLSICEGYTRAYKILVSEVGIKNGYCSSSKLNHAWNIIYIDDKPYHVDVTWDDPSWGENQRGVLGFVQHDNFLRSTSGLISEDHNASDFDSTPKDTTYDNYFWQNSNTAFTLLGDEIYYIDGSSKELKRYRDGKSLCSVYDKWYIDSSTYYTTSFARLTTDGKKLFYSSSKAVYEYNVKSNESKKIFEPSLTTGNNIYGLEYISGSLVCDINNRSPFGGGTNLYQTSYVVPVVNETEIMIKDTATFKKEDGYLKGVKLGETVSQILSQLENETVVVLGANGKVLSDNDICSTGCIINVISNGETIDSVSVVVKGEISGDGMVTTTDYAKIKSAFVGKLSLAGVYEKAADVDDSGVITSSDILKVKLYLLGNLSEF